MSLPNVTLGLLETSPKSNKYQFRAANISLNCESIQDQLPHNKEIAYYTVDALAMNGALLT